MINGKRVGYFVVAGPNTLGMDIICDLIEQEYGERPEKATIANASELDVLLVSLYWWEHKYDYIRFLVEAGIDPKKRSPIIIAGGMDMLNPAPIEDYFHYAVLGDGEEVVIPLLEYVTNGKSPDCDKYIWTAGEANEGKAVAVYDRLRATHYVEDRQNKVTRIEIARGCKRKCGFCLLTFAKPYRELPGEAIKTLIYTAPTKNVALFSADRASHSAYLEIEDWAAKYGKRNNGTDLRIDTIQKFKTATSLRFGIEGYGYDARRAVGKPYTDDQLIEWFRHVFHVVKTPKGTPITVATVYMIMGLPGDTVDSYREFAELLRRIDDLKPKRFTMFLSASTFAPYFHTGLQWADPSIFADWNSVWAMHKPFLKNITIAARGGAIQPSRRILQMLAIRGDVNAGKMMFNIAKNPQVRKLAEGKGNKPAEALLRVMDRAGIDTDLISKEIPFDKRLPWDGIESPIPRVQLEKYYRNYKGIIAGLDVPRPEDELVADLEMCNA